MSRPLAGPCRRILHCGSRGFTLVEVTAALFLGLLISAAALTLLTAAQQSEARFRSEAHRSASLRRAAQRICHTVRHAGFCASDALPGFAPLIAAGPDSLTVRRDLDGDGLTVGTGEQIRYWLDGRILREQGNPVAEGVTTLAFEYQVAAGRDGLRDWSDNDGDGLVDERGEMRLTDLPVSRRNDGRDNDGDGETDEGDETESRHVRVVVLTLAGHGPLGDGPGTAAGRELRTAVVLLNSKR
jgi:prepilin-type N-terminal cleavage/methylation domain-containing protein